MSLLSDLQTRAKNKCELCNTADELEAHPVSPHKEGSLETSILVCEKCSSQAFGDTELEPNHWRSLNETAWSQEPAVQVAAWRMLNRLSNEGWAQDLLGMIYLDDETLSWAQDSGVVSDDSSVIHKDTNGATLAAGDTIVLIKDLNVKGAGFTAKRGTAVRNISLVQDNSAQIEGRVNGQHIVILTEYVKKSGAEQAGSA